MSLILDALRKLERERTSTEDRKSVVVMAPLPWGEDQPTKRGLTLGLLGLLGLMIAGALYVAWVLAPWRSSPQPSHSAEAPSATMRPAPALTTSEPPQALPEEPPPRAWPSSPPLVAPAERSPSPTAVATPAPAPRFVLSAVSERDGQPIAMINDQIVHEGDTIAGARVTRISQAGVDLELGGEPIHLRF